MHPRTLALLALLCLVVAIGAFTYLRSDTEPTPASSFIEQWPKIQAAERITDLRERCLAYPNAPWLQWPAKTVAAFCEPLAKPRLSAAEMIAALDDGRAAPLDEAFQAYFDENFTPPQKHTALTNAIRSAFYNTEPDTERIVQKWTTLAPKSAFALLSRGYYYLSAAQEARGTEFFRETPNENIQSMHAFSEKAYSDFTEALSINPRLISAYSGIIKVAQLVSDHALVERSAQAGLELDPADSRIYLDWASASEPRWGGSMQQLIAIAELARRHLDENPILSLVVMKPAGYPGIAFENRGNYGPALQIFEKVVADAPSGDFLNRAGTVAKAIKQNDKALWYLSQARRFKGEDLNDLSIRAHLLATLGHADWAKETLANVSLRDVSDTEVARALWSLKMMPEAEQIYQNILKRSPQDKYALASLGMLYLLPPIRHDKAQPFIDRLTQAHPRYARGWLLNAVDKPAAECHESLRKYLDLVDQNDPYERNDVAMAKKRIAELERGDGAEANKRAGDHPG